MPIELSLRKIKFRAGARPVGPPLEIEASGTVILVGPNNSGKSLALREIENWCFEQRIAHKVVDGLDVAFPEDPDAAIETLREYEAPPPQGKMIPPGFFWVGLHTFNPQEPVRHFEVNPEQVRAAILDRHQDILRRYFTKSYTIRLDGRTRFSLSEPKGAGDLLGHPQNHLWALFQDEPARTRVRQLTEEAFGLHFAIDPTDIGKFRIRMGPRAPASTSEEQALDDSARKFHEGATLISELSDGVQAFVGLTSAILSLPHKIMLIDEPEAFLHPTLARRLGINLARISLERGASLVVATHSAEFLRGCLEVVGDTVVARLTYENGVATARALSSSDLVQLMRHPLLRSTGLIQGLFHRAVVVTESDADRAFYDEINRRLNSVGRGVSDVLFLNAHGKHTVHTLVAPLRRIGIPVAAIVDLDFIKESGSNWDNLLDACQIEPASCAHLAAERDHLRNVFGGLPLSADGRESIKSNGLAALSTPDRNRAEALLSELAKYGLFLVPPGELECWLPAVSAPGHGPDWLVDLFSRIGQSEDDRDYLHPGTDDVWSFLDTVSTWAQNSSRLGT